MGNAINFTDRCAIAAACLPRDDYRASLERLHAEMLAAIPAAEPLTDEQIDDMLGEANRGFCIERADYFKAVRDAEAAHRIAATKGKP